MGNLTLHYIRYHHSTRINPPISGNLLSITTMTTISVKYFVMLTALNANLCDEACKALITTAEAAVTINGGTMTLEKKKELCNLAEEVETDDDKNDCTCKWNDGDKECKEGASIRIAGAILATVVGLLM